jgi:hypothetical protein
MKPTAIAIIEHQLARHDSRAGRRRHFPATDYFFRPFTGTSSGRAPRRPSDRTRRAFRRMTAEMLAKYERDEPIELFFFACVTALATWPLVDLLIVLAQTAKG